MHVDLVKNPASHEAHGWKRDLAEAISSSEELLRLLQLEHLIASTDQRPAFRLRVPRSYVAKMRIADENDPLLRQVLPLDDELSGSGMLDPVGDLDAMLSPGLLHKYHGRVLLITTGACAIHCRYCFRRNFPYSDASLSPAHWRDALGYISDHKDIQEVILSGGDPLVLDDHKLDHLQRQLGKISHVKWLRIHTRLPVVLASRVNNSLLKWIHDSALRITLVIHANHANEIGAQEQAALAALSRAGATLLNQSVLLKRVNDSTDSMIELSHRLHECGVLPYYLHCLDKTRGAMHFEISQAQALKIMDDMRAKLPGYLVPRLVREQAGEKSKTAIFSI
jgi:EF-P beta-lysylation protein EpmB